MSSCLSERQKCHKNKVKWGLRNELLILDLWEKYLEEFRGPRKNTHIYLDMAKELREQGFQVCGYDVKCKIDNLTRRYRCEGRRFATADPPVYLWVHFGKIENLLGEFKCLDLQKYNNVFKDSPIHRQSNRNLEFSDDDNSRSSHPHSSHNNDHLKEGEGEEEEEKDPVKVDNDHSLDEGNSLASEDAMEFSSSDPSVKLRLYEMAELRTKAMVSIAKDIKIFQQRLKHNDDTDAKLLRMAETRTKAIESIAKDNKEFHKQMLELVRSQIKSHKENLWS